jgi:diacylglycerol kinase
MEPNGSAGVNPDLSGRVTKGLAAIPESAAEAIGGLWYAIRTERSVKQWLFAIAVIVTVGFWRDFNEQRWTDMIHFCIWLLFAEIVNTIAEKIVNKMSKQAVLLKQPPRDRDFRIIKHLGSAAVLVIATPALAYLIFYGIHPQ